MIREAIYISGPMSGKPDLNFPAFHEAAARLRASGHAVINPAEMDESEEAPKEWHEYLRRDIAELVKCTHIAMLPGWQDSRGATLEKHIADALGIRPIFITSEAAAPSVATTGERDTQ